MTIRSVGFQLRTDGKAEVRNDFLEVKSAGEDAMGGIAAAAEKAANDAARATDRFTDRQMAAFEKQARAAKLAAAGMSTNAGFDSAASGRGNGAQFATINLDRSTGAARQSAAVFMAAFAAEEAAAKGAAEAEAIATRAAEERTAAVVKLRAVIDPLSVAQARFGQEVAQADQLLAAGAISVAEHSNAVSIFTDRLEATRRALDTTADAEERLAKRAVALRAAIDPAYAAQQRFDTEMAEARTLIGQNAISLDDYCAKLRIEQAALDASTVGHGRMTTASGQARQSAIMLGQQIQDFSVQVVSGQSVATAFAQQIGQAAFAVQGMGGKLEAVGTFLTSFSGILTTVALTVLVPFVAKILEGNNALEQQIEKLKQDAEQTEITRRAKALFTTSVEGVAAAIRDGTEATKKSIDAQKSSAEQDNINAKTTLAREQAIRAATLASLEQAKVAAAILAGPGISGERGIGFAQRAARDQVRAITAQISEQQALIVAAEARVTQTRIALATEAAQRSVDPMAQIKRTYDAQVAAAQAKARAEGSVTAELTRQLAQIERNRQAAIKAEQDKQQAVGRTTNQIGRNVSLQEARAIAEGIGGRVTSDHRTFEEQKRLYDRYVAYKDGRGPWAALAAKPGTSNHELDQALDVAKSNGMTLAKLVAAYRQQGVTLTESLDEGDHFHLAWKKTGAAAREAALQRRDGAQQARDAAAAERELEGDLRQVVGAYDPARAAAAEYAATLAKIDALVRGRKLTIAEADTYSATARVQFLNAQAERTVATFEKLFGAGDPLQAMLDAGKRAQVERVDGWSETARAQAAVVATAMDEVRGVGNSLVDTVLSPDTWSSWGNAGKAVLSELKGEFIKLALLNPLKNLIAGDSALPTIGSVIGNLGSIFGRKAGMNLAYSTPGFNADGSFGAIGRNASGTEHWSGGMTWVAENGPELVNLPAGARITPAAETRRLLAGNDNGAAPRGDTHYHFSGNLLTTEWWAQIQAGNEMAAVRGASAGAAISQAEATSAGMRRLGRAW